MRTSALVISLSLLVARLPASAAIYHVSRDAPGASDDNPGTEAAPWKTIAKAAQVAEAGDTVYLHTGHYPESVALRAEGTARAPITFAAFADDAVILDGADAFPAERWQPLEGSTRIFATPLERDPGQVWVDAKPLDMKVDKLAPDNWRLGVLTDADANLWQYDADRKLLLLNLGGDNPGEAHRVEIPVRHSAFSLNTHCRLRGINASRYVYAAIAANGDDAVVEDCRVTDCGTGISTSGWDRRGVIIRRNTVIGCLGNGINLQDRPTGCFAQDNLVIRCTRNPWHAVLWSGSIKMNSAADTVFAHNVVLEAGNPQTINGWDGWALWGDINIVRVMYVGNSCAHNKEAGIYVEWAMGDTRAYFNTSFRDGHGITLRASQRGMYLHNYIQSSRSSGLAIWSAPEPYPTTDNVFAHNLVRDCAPSLRLQVEHPEFCDYNTYWPREGQPLADGEEGRQLRTIEELREATGHERHGEVRDAKPGDVGLATVAFRVPDAADPGEILTMVGNADCELEDPAGVNTLPYFWRPGTGDGAPHVFVYSAYAGLPGGVDSYAYGGAGGTVALRADDGIAHTGLRCLEVNGFEPSRMPAEGLGFRSPTLPARPGDTIAVSLWIRGRDLAPAEGAPLVATAGFSSQTGQLRQRVDLAPDQTGLTGTFDWRNLTATVKVPDAARRMALFFGLGKAKGTLWFDGLSFGAR